MKISSSFFLGLFLTIFIVVFSPLVTLAEDYTSPSFIVRDPVMAPSGGGYGVSSSFQYFSSLGQIAIGESNSSSFINRAGFLYFAVVTNPVLSGTSGDASVSLSWTAASASLGYTVSGYEVGVSTTSGSGYTFTNVGNVLAYNVTGLTNGTTYYFVVKVLDTLGDEIGLSSESSFTPAAAGGGGGGGAGSSGGTFTGIRLTGYAYPLSKVTVLQDGVIVAQTISGQDAEFSVRIGNLSSGNYNFAVYAEDTNSIRSMTFSFPLFVQAGSTIDVTGVFVTPTIEVDKSQVKKGDDLVIFGQTTPESDVTIQVNSETQLFLDTESNDDGVYLYNLNTAPLEMGNHSTKSKTLLNAGISSGYGKQVAFAVGTQNIPKTVDTSDVCRADLNGDDGVNLVDFSIAAFWYKKTLDTSIMDKESNCLNNSGTIDLVDFSIMAFYWTG